MTDTEQPEVEREGIDRRGFVAKAAVGVGIAWVAPSVISVSASGAQALVNSPPPKPPTFPGDDELSTGDDQGPGSDLSGEGEDLPRTGFNFQDPLTAAFGLIAAGSAVQIWSTTARERGEGEPELIDPDGNGPLGLT